MPRNEAGPQQSSGARALKEVDRAIAARPHRDGDALKAAVQALGEFRDHYIARHRGEGGSRWRPTLERVNAILSVVLAVEFPIGEVQWGELEKARGWLDEAVSDEAAR